MWILLVCTSLSWATEGSLLLVGNSYTSYNNLAAMTQTLLEQQEQGWEPIATASLAQGGYRWSQHEAALADSTSPHHGIFYGDTWSWVLLQEQSQIPGFPEGQLDREESIDAVIALNERIAALPAETVLYMTWGRRNGDTNNPSLYPDFETMSDRIDAGYLSYAEAITTDKREIWIAPAGRVFRRIYDRCLEESIEPLSPDSDFFALYSGDGSHPSPIGSALIAATVFSTLTGRSASSLEGPIGLEAADWQALTADVDHVIWGNTHGDIPFPWAYHWTDLDDWASGSTLGDQPMRPHLRIDTPTDNAPALALFDAHLELVDGGVLAVETLTLADEASFAFTGGTLQGVTQLSGVVEQTAGELQPGPKPTLDGDYTLGEAALLHLPEQLPMVINGEATLGGTIELSPTIGPGAILIEAASLNIDGLVSAEPERYTFVLEGNTLRRDGVAPDGLDDPLDSSCACNSTAAPLPLGTLTLLFAFLIGRRKPLDIH